ncbi:MAG: hypothetical protein PVJ06_03455 [Desulfobacterales bacterium]
MTKFRLQPTSVSGFPRRGSIAAYHALRPDPPSSNPACGFPALGLPENSRHGHLQGVVRFERSQIHQPQILEVIVYRPAFRSSKGPLAPSLQMCYQAEFKETVDLAKCFTWVSPREARQLHTSVASLPALGFTYPGRMATPIKYNEAETGSLALRLALSPHEASPDRVTPSHARSATCQTDNLQGELLSVHKIDQALPGAPGFTGWRGY